MWQWELDWYESPYSTASCEDCADTTDTSASYRVLRGGSFDDFAAFLFASSRIDHTPLFRASGFGFRCARTP